MKEPSLTIERKENGQYKTVNVVTDRGIIYEGIASLLMQKYVWKYQSISRLEDRPDYESGNRIIKVTFRNGYRYTYNIHL